MFIKIDPNLSYFCQKIQNFPVKQTEGLPPDRCASGGWGFCPQTPAAEGFAFPDPQMLPGSSGWGSTSRPADPQMLPAAGAPPPDPRNSPLPPLSQSSGNAPDIGFLFAT